MIACTPKYNVIYHGEFYEAGVEFPIDPEDVEEMETHGTVEEKPDAPKRPGRPRKG